MDSDTSPSSVATATGKRLVEAFAPRYSSWSSSALDFLKTANQYQVSLLSYSYTAFGRTIIVHPRTCNQAAVYFLK
jgi:aryl-alcohol dehydrogenase-like predicted oxidoreductase